MAISKDSPTNGAANLSQEEATTSESLASGSVPFSGNRKPSDDPRAVHPRRRQEASVGSTVVPPEEIEKVMGRHLAQVLRTTAAVLEGVQPDGLIRSFVLPGPSHVAKVFSQALAQKLNAPEHRPEVIIGHGTIGGIFAADITQALLDLRCPVVFLPVDRNHRSGAEGYNFLCAEDEIRTILQGKRVLLALPITTESHSAEINEIRQLVETEQCAAQVVGVVTIIQYGALTPPLDLKVEALSYYQTK